MAMNALHRWCCNSGSWARAVERRLLPWALDGVDLGENALEIGPGYGATTLGLVRRATALTVIELDPELAESLRGRLGQRVRVLTGDGTDTGLPDGEFSSVVCFLMLHHVPTVALQDRLFDEARRVLRPGGVFSGCDGLHSVLFRLAHLGDTYVPVPEDTLPRRLEAAGFGAVRVSANRTALRWRAVRPIAAPR